MKWTFTIQLLGSNLLNFTWSNEPAEKKIKPDNEAPGPITDRVTAPSTSFGMQPSSPNYVHKRATIK